MKKPKYPKLPKVLTIKTFDKIMFNYQKAVIIYKIAQAKNMNEVYEVFNELPDPMKDEQLIEHLMQFNSKLIPNKVRDTSLRSSESEEERT